MHTLLSKCVCITGIDHVTHSQEEGVREFLALTSLASHVLKDLVHRENGDTKVNCKSLGELGLEHIGRAKEHKLGIGRPTLDETAVLVKEALLETCLEIVQPHYIFY